MPQTNTNTHISNDIPDPHILDRLPLNFFFQPLQRRSIPPHVPHKYNHSVPHPRFFHCIVLCKRLSHRFLDHDMFAGVGAFDNVLGVELISCQDEDEIDGD